MMRLLGEASVVMCNDKHSAQSTVLVTADLNHAALIGWQDLQKLRVIPASFPAVAAVAQCFKDIKTKTLNSFPHVFSDTLDDKPMCAQKMHIHLKEGCIPYRVSAPRPIPLRFQEPANAEIAKYIASGTIIPCDEPRNGVHRHFLFLRGMGSESAWLRTIPSLTGSLCGLCILSLPSPTSFRASLPPQHASQNWTLHMGTSKSHSTKKLLN